VTHPRILPIGLESFTLIVSCSFAICRYLYFCMSVNISKGIHEIH